MALTVEQIFTEELTAKLEDNPEKATNINAVYQFNITGDDGGEWIMDLTKEEEFVSEGIDEDADCTVTMKDSDFVDMWEGKLPAQMAFMTGKLKISGDMSLAMKLTQVIG